MVPQYGILANLLAWVGSAGMHPCGVHPFDEGADGACGADVTWRGDWCRQTKAEQAAGNDNGHGKRRGQSAGARGQCAGGKGKGVGAKVKSVARVSVVKPFG